MCICVGGGGEGGGEGVLVGGLVVVKGGGGNPGSRGYNPSLKHAHCSDGCLFFYLFIYSRRKGWTRSLTMTTL